jgi:acyl-CoA reductase-like NAD-dependent aldehyde dehydrogenase
MPLACGNSVILKASQMRPGTHRAVGSVLRDAGFAPGVVNVLKQCAARRRLVEALIAHPAVRRVNVTGSSKVGKIVTKLCADHLKPVLLELGGKSRRFCRCVRRAFCRESKSVSVGDPREGAAVLGSLVDRSAGERVTALVFNVSCQGGQAASGWQRQRHADQRARARPRHPRDAHLSRSVLWARGGGGARQGRG